MFCTSLSPKAARVEQADVFSYHPYVAQYMTLLSSRLHYEQVLESTNVNVINQFQSQSFQAAAAQIAAGLQSILRIAAGSSHPKVAEPEFAAILAQLITITVSNCASDFADRAKAGSLPAPDSRVDGSVGCRPQDFFVYDNLKMADKLVPPVYERLKTMEPFVLDNSIRESTVAQQLGHVKEDKYSILRTVEEAGFDNIIVASFSDLPQVEDAWLSELVAEGRVRSNYLSFTELFDKCNEDKTPSQEVPLGLFKIIKYNIPNAIIELNLFQVDCFKFADEQSRKRQKWNNASHCALLLSRIKVMREEVNPDSKIFINLRDALMYWHDVPTAQRSIEIIVFLATLPPALRPTGIMFEEPMGEFFPWQFRHMVQCFRHAMDNNGWPGELLIHVHKNWGLAEACVQESLAYGCTGIWCGVSEEGGGTGSASSLITLTNLARMGNQKVMETVSFSKLFHAAKEVTFITTGSEPPPKQEVYGSRAMDILWSSALMGVSDFDVSTFFDYPSPVRINTFTTPEQYLLRLAQMFGREPHDYDIKVAEKMRKVMHRDLMDGKKFNYQAASGLYDLYVRAGGKAYLAEILLVVNTSNNPDLEDDFDVEQFRLGQASGNKSSSTNSSVNSKRNFIKTDNPLHVSDNHPLMVELKGLFDLYAAQSPRRVLDYQDFCNAFLQRFLPVDLSSPKIAAIMSVVDVDKSGDISWDELAVWGKWAILQFDLSPSNCKLDKLLHTIFVGHIFPMAFRNLYRPNFSSFHKNQTFLLSASNTVDDCHA